MKRIAIGIMIIILLITGTASAAKKKEPQTAWVMCQPTSEVYLRRFASKRAEVEAMLTVGTAVEWDGKKSGRWYHVIYPCEAGEGWIRGDYLSFTEPEIFENGKIFETNRGKVLARYSIKGNVRKKLKKERRVVVFVYAEEWCVTSEGYIMTKFLTEVEDENNPDVRDVQVR